MTYAKQMEDFGFVPANHESPLYFPVGLRPLTCMGQTINGYQAVVREDESRVLAVHSDKYALMPNERVYALFDEAIRQSGLDTTNLRVADDISHDGARAFRQYLFPGHVEEIAGTEIALRIIAFNSYDGSLSARYRAGFYRFVCANTAVIGRDAADFRVRHIGDMEEKIPVIAQSVVTSAEGFIANAKRMRRWADVPLTHGDMEQLTKGFAEGNERLENQLFADAMRANAATVWDFYNVLTAWATHASVRSAKNAAHAKTVREDKVAKYIDATPVFVTID